MKYHDVLNAIIDDGIEAARIDYSEPRNKQKLDGAIRGFTECRDCTPVDVAILLALARRDTRQWFGSEQHWYWRSRELEIEWVANVVSAFLMEKGLPVIVPVTYCGLMKAIDIVGVKMPSA
jgi:hypothetical protein